MTRATRATRPHCATRQHPRVFRRVGVARARVERPRERARAIMVLAAFVEATLGRVSALGGRALGEFGARASLGADASASASASASKPSFDARASGRAITDGVDFRPVVDTACFLTPYPQSDAATAMMLVFVVGVVVGAVPQYLKLMVLRDANGLSLASLALMNVSNMCATLNVFVLHYEQIRRCASGAVGYDTERCRTSLLTVYYTATYTVLWLPLFPLAAHYTSSRKTEYFGWVMTKRTAAWYGFALHALPVALLAAPVVSMLFGKTCYDFEEYAIFLGILNALLETVRYVPQLWESIHNHGSGAMSYLRLLLSIGGGLGATVQKAIMKESWSTWGPPLVGHGLEVAIFSVNLYNDTQRRRAREAEKDAAGKEHSELTADAESASGKTTEETDDDDDWVQGIPTDVGFGEKSAYVYRRMCTDKRFFTSLVRYL